MPTQSNDLLDLRNARYSTIRHWFIIGSIGEATYRASLHSLGLRGEDIDHEVNSAKQEKSYGN